MANTLVGSVIAIVSVAPDRDSGMIWYLWQVSPGISLIDARVDLELREVDGGNAVLLAEQRRDVFVLDEPELHQVEAELAPVGLLVGQHLLELLGGDALLFEKQFANPDRHNQNITWADRPQPRRRWAPATPATSRKNPPGTATLTPPVAAGRACAGRARFNPAAHRDPAPGEPSFDPGADAAPGAGHLVVARQVGVGGDHPHLTPGAVGVGHDRHAGPDPAIQRPA